MEIFLVAVGIRIDRAESDIAISIDRRLEVNRVVDCKIETEMVLVEVRRGLVVSTGAMIRRGEGTILRQISTNDVAVAKHSRDGELDVDRIQIRKKEGKHSTLERFVETEMSSNTCNCSS